MSASATTATTAALTPELFPEQIVYTASSSKLIAAALLVIVLTGFGFRVFQLGAEGLSEDELNKERAVKEYRARGLTSANGEHPLLMKALLTFSVVVADRWNSSRVVQTYPDLRISTETALRLPGALVGALTALLIFLGAAELFGAEVGLIAAGLWALDPAGIGFNRIAKEDTFFIFFFLLANVFWLRGQRVAEAESGRPDSYYWATAAAFGAMMASKYLPHFIAISASYYHIFQNIRATRWRMGKRRWLIFFTIMGATFLLCNPTILLPATWHEMRIFAGERRIGHDGYEFMGHLYRNQVSLWLTGSPWYFYYVFIGVKLPLPVIAGFILGLPLLFLKRLGDGRYFILFWLFFWFFPLSVMGGKFTRYFTIVLPAVLITAAIGIHAVALVLSRFALRLNPGEPLKVYARAALIFVVLACSAYASASAAPHYRLYTNTLGGGRERAGSYFPHDEFYDSSTPEIASIIAARARPAARIASETPELVTHYARLAGRDDLVSVSLSDRAAVRELAVGDFIIDARGRRYFSNDAIITKVRAVSEPVDRVELGGVTAAHIYVIDEPSHAAISGVIER